MAQTVKCLSTMWETWVWSLGQEVPWRRKWQPTPVLLPRKSHGWRRLVSMGLQRVGLDWATSLSLLYLNYNPLSHVSFANIFFQSVACLFIQLFLSELKILINPGVHNKLYSSVEKQKDFLKKTRGSLILKLSLAGQERTYFHNGKKEKKSKPHKRNCKRGEFFSLSKKAIVSKKITMVHN